ncbi:hypothetical protein EDEG_03102 [Edhazardia aedis USNM 41457]|uniref:Uncharacterized protein n=1 Tax=Edhazardia aedis (strain USNM 41457) TaxID=1003232 RepID=J9DM74_EDHAE|nr:hypothetical protein EDEG_03102 [Edhazardia aedis USNM 41457]|eukprot:EJW02482.1 hypothetical protein EDEG_03102 [Edhazardia aedis USNM 41457]
MRQFSKKVGLAIINYILFLEFCHCSNECPDLKLHKAGLTAKDVDLKGSMELIDQKVDLAVQKKKLEDAANGGNQGGEEEGGEEEGAEENAGEGAEEGAGEGAE